MLVRAEYWWFGILPNDSLNATTAPYFLSDYGPPLGGMQRAGYVFSRQYTNATVALDCTSFLASFTPTERS